MYIQSKKLISTILCASILALGLATTANAALESRLGGLAVYDTDLDITWLADANAGAGSSFDDADDPNDGKMTWDNAVAWAADLDIYGVSGWRLPAADPVCGRGANCFNSEMGHLFYNELGGTYRESILFSSDPDLALFTNIPSINGWTWTGTEFAPNSIDAWIFDISYGGQGVDGKHHPGLSTAWAVHSGDVGLLSPVPEPHQYAMMVLGLAGLLGYARLRRRI